MTRGRLLTDPANRAVCVIWKVMSELPDNVDLRWISRHFLDFHEEMRRELASLRTDIDRHTVLLRRLDETASLTLRQAPLAKAATSVAAFGIKSGAARSRAENL